MHRGTRRGGGQYFNGDCRSREMHNPTVVHDIRGVHNARFGRDVDAIVRGAAAACRYDNKTSDHNNAHGWGGWVGGGSTVHTTHSWVVGGGGGEATPDPMRDHSTLNGSNSTSIRARARSPSMVVGFLHHNNLCASIFPVCGRPASVPQRVSTKSSRLTGKHAHSLDKRPQSNT